MVIHKILNNNLILSRDGQGHEVIVKGCGIAFQKKKGQQVEESRIEKIFTAENAQISKEIQGYPVSYTHLDVYKRQADGRTGALRSASDQF